MALSVKPYLENRDARVIGVVAHPVRLHLNINGVLRHLHVGQTNGALVASTGNQSGVLRTLRNGRYADQDRH